MAEHTENCTQQSALKLNHKLQGFFSVAEKTIPTVYFLELPKLMKVFTAFHILLLQQVTDDQYSEKI